MKIKNLEQRVKPGERAKIIVATGVATATTFHFLGLPVTGYSSFRYWLTYVVWSTLLCVFARFALDLAEPGLKRLFGTRKHRPG